MASLFGVNPFSTPVGQRIEKATDGLLASEDWALNLEICDIINETDEGPKDATKAIRKRLSNNRNFKSVLLTLTVVESCVKNCGHRFHILIAKKDFLDEMTRILNPKNNPPQVVQDKILSLIQDWVDAFRNSPDMESILQTYEVLRAQGIEFPAKNLDSLSPIFTPQRTQPERPATAPGRVSQPLTPVQGPVAAHIAVPMQQQQPQQQPQQPQQPPVTMVGPINPTPEQLAKLKSELDVVQGNVQVMSEMLTEMTPGQEESGDLELLQELNRTCRSMQQRIMELLEKVANEEVLGELLRINDDLNNVFIRYDRYERFRQAQSKPAEPPRPATAAATIPVMPARPSTLQASPAAAVPVDLSDTLISFDDATVPSRQPPTSHAVSSDQLPSQIQTLSINGTQTALETELQVSAEHDDEFDMFAQSRQSTFEESRKGGTSYSDNLQPFDRAIADSMSVEMAATRGSVPNPSLAEAKASQPRPDDSARGDSAAPKIIAMESIEAWLMEDNEDKQDGQAAVNQPDTMSSTDFDQFLAERAAAGGQRTGGSMKERSGSQRPPQRKMQMDNQAEDEFFGL